MAVLSAYVQRQPTPQAVARFNTEVWQAEEQARLSRQMTVCVLAGAIPRRLGADAGSKELARDKRLARRVAHACRRVLTEWGGDPEALAGPQPELKRAAAQVQWERFAQEQIEHAEQRRAAVAALAIKTGSRSWGNRAVHLYSMEVEALRYALR